METDVISLVRNPLVQAGTTGNYLRLVLTEAARWGMPGSTISLLDDLAAMLGFYQPLPKGPAAHVAGPLVNWRTHPEQPHFERIHDVEKLAFSQRALIAFGGGRPGHMIGTAEIVIACGNILQGTSPPEYYEIFQWAGVDVLNILTGDTPETILADPSKKHWKQIPDEDVLRPGGRLYKTYETIATTIRREAIAAMNKSPDNPRELLRPLAVNFLKSHVKTRARLEDAGATETVARLDETCQVIRTMFPDIDATPEHLEQVSEIVEQADASE
jgi:hypothetical protein